MKPQQWCDDLFDALEEGRLTRGQYVSQIDQLYGRFPLSFRRSLDKRRDRRSLGEFALAVYDNTVREKFLIETWAALVAPHGVQLVDNGVGNDGRLVLEPRGRGGAADYLLVSRGVYYKLEVKYAPYQGFVTYKVDDLENYASQGDVVVLTIMGDSRQIGANGDPVKESVLSVPRGLLWFLMGRSALGRVFSEGQWGNHNGFGGKPTVRVPNRLFPRVFGRVFPWEGLQPFEVESLLADALVGLPCPMAA